MRRVSKTLGAVVGVLMSASFLPMVAPATAAPVGSGFQVTPSDLSFILKQIQIAEQHAATATAANPCSTLIGAGVNQIPNATLSFGLRTVDGSCNNLVTGQENFGATDQMFPRLATPTFNSAEGVGVDFFGPGSPPVPISTYAGTSLAPVFDSQPRMISNLISDQTSTNPAAVQVAGNPKRTQAGAVQIVPCTTDPSTLFPLGVPAGCTPSFQTLFIPNVTTDVGLSPPYNSVFTLFGQFFDHGVDQTVKGGAGKVFVPLKADDPLIAGPDHILVDVAATAVDEAADNLPAHLRFMVLSRASFVGATREAKNTNSPWIDQSQTYTSHPSHQVFLREYSLVGGRPVSTGKLLGGPVGPTAGGMATWATVKAQARNVLGLDLQDKDVTNIPLMAVDAYGKFIPGPARGMPQYATSAGLLEGNLAVPVAVPSTAIYFDTPFLTDIAHNADPSPQTSRSATGAPITIVPTPDLDTVASADFATQPAGTYDNEMLDAHFIAGDGRVNENIGLTAVHQVFHSEHDRLVDDIKNVLTTAGGTALTPWQATAGAGGWNGERLFQAARFITEMEYQHIVFEDFGRKIQPGLNLFGAYQTDVNAAISAEFAHAVYRFGHSMLTENIDRINEDGTRNDISLLKGFLNPPEYTKAGVGKPDLTSEQAAGAVLMGMADQTASELDEFMTDTLRNNLVGLPLDLASLNLTRSRSEGLPSLNGFRRQINSQTGNAALAPYVNWVDFGEGLKHPESLVNFVAAYGTHATITAATTLAGKRDAARAIVKPTLTDIPPSDAGDFMFGRTPAYASTAAGVTTTGVDGVDMWVGGLAERTDLFGGLLGSTFNYVFETQMAVSQSGDRFYYLARTPGMNLLGQLEGNSFAELVMRNTTAHTLPIDAFSTADCKFQLGNLTGEGAVGAFITGPGSVNDDPLSECNENRLLLRQPNGTIQYREINSVDPAGINGQGVYNGTPGVDRVRGGNDNDTFWGNEGNDVIEGGGGADTGLGGVGNDIITDANGDDVPRGGPGNDAINSGPGLDIVIGGDGKDFTNGGANANETFAGGGDDFVIAGANDASGTGDTVFGDGGDDWVEGGFGPDLMLGDSGNPFFLDDTNRPGHDVLIGQGGNDDYDMEGGDDIGQAGPGIETVTGSSGFDWSTGQGEAVAQDMDLTRLVVPVGGVVGIEDRYTEVEGLSGTGAALDDNLRGANVVPRTVGGVVIGGGGGGIGAIGCDVLDQQGLDRISGIGGPTGLVTSLPTPLATVVAASAANDCPLLSGNVWGEGDILLGGAGNDRLEGRGANDILEGDKYLNVRLSVRDNLGTEIGSATGMNSPYLPGNATTLQQAVFAGTVDPGNIVVVREILTGAPGTDTAVFSDAQANYLCIVGAAPAAPCGLVADPTVTTQVVHAFGLGLVPAGLGNDGTDTIRNIENLLFADSAAPGTPVIGPAVAANLSATVNWTPAPGALAASYTVQIVGTGGAILGSRTALGGATSLLVTGLTNGTPYRFQVLATNRLGSSGFSILSNTVTPATMPDAPTIGVATGGNATATARWTAPAITGGSPVTGYTVQVINAAGVQIGALRLAGATATSLVVTGLTNGTTYRFRVRTVTAAGTSVPSATSNAVIPAAVVVVTVSGAPTILNAASGASGGVVDATANWAAPANNGGSVITGYTVQVLNSAGVQVGALRTVAGVGARSLVVTGLTDGTTYRFRVRAVNAIGSSLPSLQSNQVTAR